MLDQILSASEDRIFMCDREGRYLLVSPAGARALGREPPAMVGKAWWEFGLPSEAAGLFDTWNERVLATGQPETGEVRFPTAGGSGTTSML